MPNRATVIEVERLDDLRELVGHMEVISRVGRGWINVQPELPIDRPPPSSGAITQFIRRSSPDAALGTWTPAPTGPTPGPQQLGVQHHLGGRILPELERLGLTRPTRWKRVQDSPRRGLVLELPTDEDPRVIMSWLLELIAKVSTVETTGRWLASIHEGRTR